MDIEAIIATVNSYPKRKRFNVHAPYRFSAGYLVPVYSDYAPITVMGWFLSAGAMAIYAREKEDVSGVTEFYVEVE